MNSAIKERRRETVARLLSKRESVTDSQIRDWEEEDFELVGVFRSDDGETLVQQVSTPRKGADRPTRFRAKHFFLVDTGVFESDFVFSPQARDQELGSGDRIEFSVSCRWRIQDASVFVERLVALAVSRSRPLLFNQLRGLVEGNLMMVVYDECARYGWTELTSSLPLSMHHLEARFNQELEGCGIQLTILAQPEVSLRPGDGKGPLPHGRKWRPIHEFDRRREAINSKGDLPADERTERLLSFQQARNRSICWRTSGKLDQGGWSGVRLLEGLLSTFVFLCLLPLSSPTVFLVWSLSRIRAESQEAWQRSGFPGFLLRLSINLICLPCAAVYFLWPLCYYSGDLTWKWKSALLALFPIGRETALGSRGGLLMMLQWWADSVISMAQLPVERIGEFQFFREDDWSAPNPWIQAHPKFAHAGVLLLAMVQMAIGLLLVLSPLWRGFRQ